jgi:hypothetical protein
MHGTKLIGRRKKKDDVSVKEGKKSRRFNIGTKARSRLGVEGMTLKSTSCSSIMLIRSLQDEKRPKNFDPSPLLFQSTRMYDERSLKPRYLHE